MLNVSEGTKTYLHFVSFLHIDMTQVVEILPQVRQEIIYSTLSISWVLMPWRCKEPRHQQPRYWLCWTELIWSPHVNLNERTFISSYHYPPPCIGTFVLVTFWPEAPRRQEVTTDLIIPNMDNDVVPLISTIILPKVLTCFSLYSLKHCLWFIDICMWYLNAT